MAGIRANTCPNWLDDVLARRKHDYCPLCDGRGRLKLEIRAQRRTRRVRCSVCDPDGKFFGEWCWRCHGSKIVEVVELPVNPAGIRRTGSGGGGYMPSTACMAIDELVSGWRESDETIWWHRVVVREYCYNGTQKLKAQQLRVSLSFYEKRLREATCAVDRMLFERGL